MTAKVRPGNRALTAGVIALPVGVLLFLVGAPMLGSEGTAPVGLVLMGVGAVGALVGAGALITGAVQRLLRG